MSTVHVCDVCGATIQNGAPMMVVDITALVDGNDGTGSSWSDIDLCRECAIKLLDVIGGAMDGLDPNWHGPKP